MNKNKSAVCCWVCSTATCRFLLFSEDEDKCRFAKVKIQTPSCNFLTHSTHRMVGSTPLSTPPPEPELTMSARAMYRNIPPAMAKIALGAKLLPSRMPNTRPR